MITLACYFYFLKKHQHALEDYVKNGGKLTPKWCKYMKNNCEKKDEQAPIQPTKAQSPVFEYSIVENDKEFPQVVAPQPQVQTYRIEKEAQQMV